MLICRCCGRDLDEICQDNMSDTEQPLCEDCFLDMDNENYLWWLEYCEITGVLEE